MDWYHYLLIALAIIILLFFITLYICFRLTFFSNRKKRRDEFSLPPGKVFLEHKDTIFNAIKYAKSLNPEILSIKTFDGLTLKAKYFEYIKGAPIELMFHGYRGDSLRDLSIGIERCFKLNRNCVIVDQRASGESEGKVISFGINERHDCKVWVDKLIERFGDDVKIILTGISMGASTVLMASGSKLPKNVIGVLADCGFNRASDVIKNTVKHMHLPVFIFYPLIKLSARIFGKFNLEETSAIEEIQKTNLPIIFIHGESDKLVPHYMSEEMYKLCPTRKKLVSIKNAGHGVAYLIDPNTYLTELDNFFKDDLK